MQPVGVTVTVGQRSLSCNDGALKTAIQPVGVTTTAGQSSLSCNEGALKTAMQPVGGDYDSWTVFTVMQ